MVKNPVADVTHPSAQIPQNAPLITRIHNKHYDLSTFKHPGGPVAIALIKNRDGTELFESHHQFSTKSITALLSRYEIPDPLHTIPASNIYNWEKTKSSPFTKALKNLALTEIGTNIKSSPKRVFELLIIYFVFISQIVQFYLGYWHTVLTLPLTYWIAGVNTFHDASHFALSNNWRINSLGTNMGLAFTAPYTWYHQHVIGHHCFPNILGKDPDLYHAPRLIRHSADIRYRIAHLYQSVTFVFTWMVGVPFGLILNGTAQAFSRKAYNRVVDFANCKNLNPNSLIFRFFLYFLVTHVSPLAVHGLGIKGVVFAVVPIYLFSVFFMVSTQINHLTPETTDQMDENFFVHQVITSHNVAVDSYLVYLFTGGLNMQIEHHLFPSLNHCHLKKIVPKVKALCLEHGVKYSESKTLWEALLAHVEHLREYSVKN